MNDEVEGQLSAMEFGHFGVVVGFGGVVLVACSGHGNLRSEEYFLVARHRS